MKLIFFSEVVVTTCTDVCIVADLYQCIFTIHINTCTQIQIDSQDTMKEKIDGEDILKETSVCFSIT